MAVSRTAQYVALYRALESIEDRPRFRDPFAPAFLSFDLALAVRLASLKPLRALLTRYADLRAPGARTSAIARTCFIDYMVRTTAAAGVRQVARFVMWTNHVSDGPSHSFRNVPVILWGNAAGYLEQGQYVDAANSGNNRLLNTLISAAIQDTGTTVENFGEGTGGQLEAIRA